jgi:hypothetical protein
MVAGWIPWWSCDKGAEVSTGCFEFECELGLQLERRWLHNGMEGEMAGKVDNLAEKSKRNKNKIKSKQKEK